MIKHTQVIRWLNCLSVFDHFLGLALKVLLKDSCIVEKNVLRFFMVLVSLLQV